jgi:hypothetical protein
MERKELSEICCSYSFILNKATLVVGKCQPISQPILPSKPILNLKERKTAQPEQGCQMVYFHTKNTYLGKFWSALEWKSVVFFGLLKLPTCLLNGVQVRAKSRHHFYNIMVSHSKSQSYDF